MSKEQLYTYRPDPTEETLTRIVIKEVDFPNGRTMKVRMSEWHWAMVEFFDRFKVRKGWEHGILYEWYKASPNCTDADFSDSIMLLIRDNYNQYRS